MTRIALINEGGNSASAPSGYPRSLLRWGIRPVHAAAGLPLLHVPCRRAYDTNELSKAVRALLE
jgi:hypothetical protein